MERRFYGFPPFPWRSPSFWKLLTPSFPVVSLPFRLYPIPSRKVLCAETPGRVVSIVVVVRFGRPGFFFSALLLLR